MAQQWLSLVAIVATVPLVVLVSNVIHELGHALAALSVGYRVRGFVVGGTGADFTRSGRFLQFGRKFGKATAIVSPRHGWISGRRGIVAYGGGIAMNFVAVALALPDGLGFARCGLTAQSCAAKFGNGPLPASGMLAEQDLVRYVGAISILFCGINIFQAATNLWPRVLASGAVTDAKHILNLVEARHLVEWIQVAESTVVVDRPRAQVWEFLDNPENTPRYDPTVIRAYRKPGTSAGVGRIIVTERRPSVPGAEGPAQEAEVIAFEPPRRVIVRSAGHQTLRAETLLRAFGPGATRLTRTVWLGAKPTLTPEQRKRMLDALSGIAAELNRDNEAIRRLLEPEHLDGRAGEQTRMTQAIRIRRNRNTRALARRQP
ncbi:SRPBCC family protein [Pseudofrankia asymbiotica]|uniref:Uncharacterized protein n=1 Tax=Pseudofrankia asymbiotica TaxID=1834516 RepID=A0A1V2I4Z8_9ACTN|nr:SRPBCC family protein [Pseudofrankia asymbiotica]ONH25768.1 hypothetical protein BL253_26690 [Pseudofrankia asymbiotica]